MFEAAVTKFAKAIGGEDLGLIPVPSLVSAARCDVFDVVLKKYRRWFWQTPVYEPTGFKLQDILVEENVIDKSLIKTELLLPSYSKINKLKANGKLGAKLKGLLELEIHGLDSIDVETIFGKINKTQIEPEDMLKTLHKK